MKTLKKSLSVLLAVAVLFSMFAFTVAASGPFSQQESQITGDEESIVDIEAEQTNSDPAIYKFTVYGTCAKPMLDFDVRIYYDKSVWKVIGKNGAADSKASNTGYNKLGQFTDNRDGEIEVATDSAIPDEHRSDFEDEYVSGVGTGSFTFNVTNVNPNQYGSLDTNKYGCVLFQWMANFDAESVMFLAPTKEPVFSFYMQVLPGVELTAENSEVGQVEGGKAWTIDYSVDNDLHSLFTGDQKKTHMTINNAVPGAVAETKGPKVEYKGGQYKMTATDAETVADEFQFRVISKISDADWKAYLSNTGSSEENNCVTKLGFVAYKGTEDFDMDQAKAAAKAGETQDDYYVATTNYVKHADGTDAEFAACIKTSKTTCADATCIAFIQYKDADGTEQYAFYDAEYTALLKTNYTSLVQKYLATNPYKG